MDCTEEEFERRMGFARQEVAKAWCASETSHIEMNVALAEEFAKLLVEHMYDPHLGCATTRELFQELMARSDNLDYRTIDN